MSWVILAVLAAAFGGAATTFNKYIFVKLSKDPMVQITSGGIVGAVLSMVITSAHGHGTLSNFHAFIGVLAGMAFGIGLTSSMYAIKIGDVSQVGPLRFLAPLFVAILAAIFLDEHLAAQAYLGILLIITGAALLDNTKSITIKLNSVLGLMIIAGMALGVMQVLVKYLTRFSDPYTILLYVRSGLFIFILPLLALNYKSLLKAIKPNPWKNTWLLIIPGIFGTSGMFMLMFAVDKGPVTLATTIGAATPFFILLYVGLLGHRFPDVYAERAKDVNLVRRALLICLMFIGVSLVL